MVIGPCAAKVLHIVCCDLFERRKPRSAGVITENRPAVLCDRGMFDQENQCECTKLPAHALPLGSVRHVCDTTGSYFQHTHTLRAVFDSRTLAKLSVGERR